MEEEWTPSSSNCQWSASANLINSRFGINPARERKLKKTPWLVPNCPTSRLFLFLPLLLASVGNGVLDLYHAGTMLENIKLTNRGKVAACNGINDLLIIRVGAGIRDSVLACCSWHNAFPYWMRLCRDTTTKIVQVHPETLQSVTLDHIAHWNQGKLAGW